MAEASEGRSAEGQKCTPRGTRTQRQKDNGAKVQEGTRAKGHKGQNCIRGRSAERRSAKVQNGKCAKVQTGKRARVQKWEM